MKRRHFLTVPALGAAIPASAQETRRARALTPSSIEVFRIRVNRRGGWLLVQVKAGALTGIGEASHSQNDPKAAEAVQEVFSLFRGRSIFDIEPARRAFWPRARQLGKVGACAFSAVEQALYDLQGKALGLPCWALFGGQIHSRIRHYANINRATFDRTPEGFVKTAEAAIAAGFDAIKLAPFDGMPKEGASAIRAHTELGVKAIEAVRRTIGPERELFVDGHHHFDRERGLELVRTLEPMKLDWLEEICSSNADLAAINRVSAVPTAGGESLFGVEQFFPYLADHTVDIAMPDVKYCGGMGELKKIAAMAEGAGLLCSPHGPASPVGNTAAAHVCVSMPNFFILELGFGEVPWRGDLINPPERFQNGHLTLSDAPGLGIELNRKAAAAVAV